MKTRARRKGPVRASISFPLDIYQILERLAKEKKVSLAWVVREAAERYVAQQQAEPSLQGTKALRTRANNDSSNTEP
jgi:Ribbon-helix-helix protein, copG family